MTFIYRSVNVEFNLFSPGPISPKSRNFSFWRHWVVPKKRVSTGAGGARLGFQGQRSQRYPYKMTFHLSSWISFDHYRRVSGRVSVPESSSIPPPPFKGEVGFLGTRRGRTIDGWGPPRRRREAQSKYPEASHLRHLHMTHG